MSFTLHCGETVEQGVRRLLLKQLQQAQQCLQPTRASETKAIHEARKSLKKSRALLRLVRADIGKSNYKKWNECARDIARTVSPVRDAQVLAATLENLLAESSDPSAFRLARATTKRVAEETGNAAVPDPKTLSKVQRDIKALVGAAGELSIPHSGWKAISPNLNRVYRTTREAFAAVYLEPTDLGFHDWRKNAKYLRHQIAVLRECWKAPLDELIEQLHRLSDLLGEDHDLVVLRELVRKEPTQFGSEEEVGALYTRIGERQDHLRKTARTLGGKLFVEKPGAFTRRLRGYWQQWHRPPVAASFPPTHFLAN